jgi:phosphoenolpyruvate carboxylase
LIAGCGDRHLLNERDRIQLTPDELRAAVEAGRNDIEILWLTGELRLEKPTVAQELAWGHYFVNEILFDVVPQMLARVERALGRAYPGERFEIPPFFQFGSWIGGDRDGNPFVTHDVILHAAERQSALALDFYMGEVYRIGRRLSLTERLVDIDDELAALAEASPDRVASRTDEPYRRVLIGIYARLAATSQDLGHAVRQRRPIAPAVPYKESGEFVRELDVVIHSLQQHKSELLAKGELRHLRRAAEVFGFHLLRWTCGNTAAFMRSSRNCVITIHSGSVIRTS